MSGFEWNPAKSRQNKREHGVSFEEALEMWTGVHLNIENLAYSKDRETRSATLGYVSGSVYLAIWTLRNETIRIITVRKARRNEKETFLKRV